MAILEFLYSRKLAQLARSLAQQLARRYPPAIANNPIQTVSQQRLSDILEEVFAQVAGSTRENKLGWAKRIRLGNGFRWELREMGYDEKFIAVAADGLIAHVTGGASAKN